MRIVTEKEAWELLRDVYMQVDKENLVEIVLEHIECKGYLTLKGLAEELQNEIGEEFKVFKDGDIKGIEAAKVLYGDK